MELDPAAPFSFDDVPVGLVKIVEGGVIGWANAAFLTMVRAPSDRVVGRAFVDVLAPEDSERIADRYQKRLRGVQVPSEYEAVVQRGDGTQAVVSARISVLADGALLAVLRDVTDTVRRRELRLELAQLGTALYRERTEARVDHALRRGARVQALGVTWLYVDPAAGRMRVRYADLPGGDAKAWGAAPRARLEGMEGPWTRTVREAWHVGEGYSDAVLWEFAQFAAAQHDAPRGEPTEETLRGVAVRLYDEGAASVLVFVGEWLREDDAVILRQCVAQMVLALANARDLERAERRERDLQAVNALARKVLGATQAPVDEILRSGAHVIGDALSVRAVRALRIDSTRRQAREVTAEPSAVVPLGDEGSALATLSDPAMELLDGRDTRLASLAQRGLVAAGTRVIPLVARGRVEGAICLDDCERPLAQDELYLLRAMARVVQVGMENAALYDELRERVAELQSTQERLVQRERLAALGELAAVVAHEVRNPLAVMFNALGTLDRQLRLEGEQKILFTLLKEEAERLNRIVGDLQDFVRPMTLRLAPLDVASLVEPSLHAAGAVIPQALTRVRVNLEVAPRMPRVLADDRLLRQALVNLLVNGFQAMPQGGALTVRLRPMEAGRGVLLEIGDTGAGINEESRARIFEPFYTTKATGTGLGLAVVKRIVEQHGGSVTVSSALGRGTTFAVWIPTRAEDEPA